MIGGIEPHTRQTTIIGGGIAGMLAAYRLGAAGFEVTLQEKGPWLGGLIGTTHYPYGMVERAAHSLRASTEVVQFCEEIGVELTPVRGATHGAIYRDGDFRRFPLNGLEALVLLARAIARPAHGQRMTLEAFGNRFMGKAATDYLLTPMCFGIYGARPGELVVPEAFPRFQIERGRNLLSHLFSYRLLKRGKAPIMAPLHGMQDIVSKLEEALRSMPNVSIQMQQPVECLEPGTNRILAVPAEVAATLLTEEDEYTSGLLSSVRYAPLITATVFMEREAMGRFPRGLGVLIPEAEDIAALGVLFNSASFEGRVQDPGLESLTVMLGGTPHPELLELEDAALEAHITQVLDRLFGLSKPPLKMHITKWPQAIPLYDAHLALTQQRAREGWGALLGNVLVGNYTGQVSVRGMIESSLKLSETAAL